MRHSQQMGPAVRTPSPHSRRGGRGGKYVSRSTMQEEGARTWPIAFGLIYFTFFLDNVLLTVLVPIIPDWIRGESLALWAAHDAPLALVLNTTVHRLAAGAADHTSPGVGASQAVVGLVLSAKALAQLAAAGPAAAAVCRLGPARVLRAGTALLLLAALVFSACSGRGGAGGGGAAVWAGAGRAVQGAGAAAAGVAGLALAAACVPPAHRDRALGALLGAVALGVLVGYPFGGATYALWSRGAPFVIIATALLVNLIMQYMFLDKEEFNQPSECGAGAGAGVRAALAEARAESAGACAGAVLLTTSVMAALEPCLPLWIMDKFHPQRWVSGAVFVPDSAAYLVAASALGGGGAVRALGAERVALAGQAAVGGAALWLPLARSAAGLAAPHALLGAGLGALDAALVPALLARRPRRAPARAALLQAAAAAAYVLGPVAGGALAAAASFESAMRALAVANLLYAAYLYRALRAHPLSPQWGASSAAESAAGSDSDAEAMPLRSQPYEAVN